MQWYWIIAAALVIVSALMHQFGILRFDTSLHWSAWVVAALVLLNGGWMAFDGGRALLIGDYAAAAAASALRWRQYLTATLWDRIQNRTAMRRNHR